MYTKIPLPCDIHHCKLQYMTWITIIYWYNKIWMWLLVLCIDVVHSHVYRSSICANLHTKCICNNHLLSIVKIQFEKDIRWQVMLVVSFHWCVSWRSQLKFLVEFCHLHLPHLHQPHDYWPHYLNFLMILCLHAYIHQSQMHLSSWVNVTQ